MFDTVKRKWMSRELLKKARSGKDVDTQLELLKGSIAHDPTNGDAHRLLLTVAKGQGLLHDLLPWYHGIAQRYPSEAAVFSYWGGTYFLLGELESAQEKCEQAKSLNPNLVSARSNLALVTSFYGRYHEAIADLEWCLKLEPDNSSVHGNLGLDYQSIGQTDKALAHLTRAVELEPNAYRMNVLADLYFQLGDDSRAQNWYRRGLGKDLDALTLEIRHIPSLLNLAQCFLRHKDYARCNEILERCLTVPSAEENLSLHKRAGEAYLEQGLCAKAIHHLERALVIAADNRLLQDVIYRNLAKAYYLTGEFHRSTASFQLASACRHSALTQDIHWLAHMGGVHDAARRATSPTSSFRHAQLLYEQGHWETALSELQAALETPDCPSDVHILIGWMHVLLDNTNEAWKHIYLGIYHHHDVAAPFLLAGMAALFEGSYDQARFYLRHTLSLDNQSATAWRLLGHVHGNQAHYDQALACYEQAQRLHPELCDIQYNLAVALWRLGQPEDAATHLTLLLAEQPDHLLGLALQGDLLSKLGREDEARASWQRVLEINPYYQSISGRMDRKD